MAKITKNKTNKENDARRIKSQQKTAEILRNLDMGKGKPLVHMSGKDVYKTREKPSGSFEVYDPRDRTFSKETVKKSGRISVRADEPGYAKARAGSFTEDNPVKSTREVGAVKRRAAVLNDKENAMRAREHSKKRPS